MTVFAITQQENHDFTTLSEFGDVNILFPLGINIIDADVIIEAAKEWLLNFDYETDHFLPLGSPLAVAIVSLVLMSDMKAVETNSVLMLEWDKRFRKYTEKEVSL